jgi:hypothetical protein
MTAGRIQGVVQTLNTALISDSLIINREAAVYGGPRVCCVYCVLSRCGLNWQRQPVYCGGKANQDGSRTIAKQL